jgi:signal transducing adaptor molecule
MLHTLDLAKDNLADNEEIQELYRSCMSLRPKIVKLIDKYSQKRGMLSSCKTRGRHRTNYDDSLSATDLVSMNETFVKACTIFDRMMEETLERQRKAMGRDDRLKAV